MRRPAIVGMCSVVLAAACSAGGGTGAADLPADVAGGLAARADRVAGALDSGACDQALAEARSLQADISALTVDPAVKAEALAGAARLAAAIVCAPPTTTTTAAPPAPPGTREPGGGKGKKDKGGDKGGDEDGGDRDRGGKDDD